MDFNFDIPETNSRLLGNCWTERSIVKLDDGIWDF